MGRSGRRIRWSCLGPIGRNGILWLLSLLRVLVCQGSPDGSASGRHSIALGHAAFCCGLQAGGRFSPGRRLTFLLVQESKQRNTPLLSVSPVPAALGQPAMLDPGACRITHYAPRRSVQTDAASMTTKACVLRHTPAPGSVLLGTARRGKRDPAAAMPSLRSAWKGTTPPSVCACDGAFAGWHARPSAHAS